MFWHGVLFGFGFGTGSFVFPLVLLMAGVVMHKLSRLYRKTEPVGRDHRYSAMAARSIRER